MSTMQRIISPSLLSADFTNLEKQIELLEAAGIKRLHLDVMDGRFVPNLTFGPLIVEAVSRLTDCHLESHLMIEEPQNFFEQFIRAGSDTIIFHYEASSDVHRDIRLLKENGVLAGISIIPSTPVDVLIPYLDMLDYILVMSVYPGFGGQSFIRETQETMRKLATLRQGRDYLIAVDGGVNLETIREVYETGIDISIVGSGFFDARDLAERHRELLDA